MIRRPPRSTQSRSSAASDVYKRQVVHHHAACGACRFCRAGEDVMCPEWKKTRLHPGGLAEYVRVEAATVATATLRLPDALSFEAVSYTHLTLPTIYSV